MKDDQFRGFVNSFTWIYAKTYAKVCPHEYIVKDRISKDNHDLFVQVVRYIREKGFTANYKGRTGQYYILDDHYYWTMGAPVEETTVLNRAKLSEYRLIDNSWVWNGEYLDSTSTNYKVSSKLESMRVFVRFSFHPLGERKNY